MLEVVGQHWCFRLHGAIEGLHLLSGLGPGLFLNMNSLKSKMNCFLWSGIFGFKPKIMNLDVGIYNKLELLFQSQLALRWQWQIISSDKTILESRRGNINEGSLCACKFFFFSLVVYFFFSFCLLRWSWVSYFIFNIVCNWRSDVDIPSKIDPKMLS